MPKKGSTPVKQNKKLKMRKLSSIKSLEGYDFIDLGAGDGASLINNERKIGGRGLGIELDPKKVEAAIKAGLGDQVVLGDALKFGTLEGKVSYVSCDNFLEHLHSNKDTEKVIEQSIKVAKDFIYIRHPSFDDIEYLKQFGLKTYWSDWSGHPNMLTIVDIIEMFKKYGINWIQISPVSPIKDSSDPRILPAGAPIDQHEYDPKKHGPKPKKVVKFKPNLFYAYDIIGLMPGNKRVFPVIHDGQRHNVINRPKISRTVALPIRPLAPHRYVLVKVKRVIRRIRAV